jgi:6-phosphogluconate dehydrogenase
VPLPLITESVFARYISAYKEERVAASKILSAPDFKFEGDKAELIEKFVKRFTSRKSCLMPKDSHNCVASKENNWDLPFGEIALSGVLDVSSVLVSYKKLQMLMVVMKI